MSTLKSRKTKTMLALLAAATGLQEPCSDLLQSIERQLTEQRQAPYDRGGLIRCGTDNSGWHPPTAAENRVVYFGDQITDVGYRGSADSVSGQSRLNPGLAGLTTDQVLIRFRRDVIDLYNKVAVNLVGVNDINLKHELTSESVLPNNTGCGVMALLAEEAVADSLHR